MRLENVLALTHGKLVSEPFVSSFGNIVFDSKIVKRGDLFIAFDEEMIEEAILNGAYGVMFDKPTQISDTEIAWIKVQNCEDSLKKLLRFKLVEKEINVFKTNEIVLKLAQQVITESNFIIITGDVKSIHKKLLNIENNSTILFSPTLFDETLFTNVKELPKVSTSLIKIRDKTLFETSFIYDNKFYERQLISPIFIPYLEELLNLYKSLNINFRLKKFTTIENFEAVFVNKNFEIKEFGSTDKVLIFENNIELVESEINFLQKNANWANIIYLLPVQNNAQSTKNIYKYKDKKDIRRILKKIPFHFAYIVGIDKSILEKPFTKQTQLTLF